MPSVSHSLYFCSDKWHQTFMNVWNFELRWEAQDEHVRKAVWVMQLGSVHVFWLQDVKAFFTKIL